MRRALFGIVVVMIVAGCGHVGPSAPGTPVKTMERASPSSVPRVGVVYGTLGIIGGVKMMHPTRCGCWPEPGTVRFISAHGKRIDTHVGRRGTFSVRLPGGRYTAIAGLSPPMQWPMGSCRLFGGKPRFDSYFDRRRHTYYVSVHAGRRSEVSIACIAG
jgi:hypothetical protein